MKKILCCLALIFVVFVIPVSAAETDSTQSQDDAMFQEYYEQQAEDSGANDLPNYLPDDTKSQLDQMGISGVDWNSIQSIQPNSVFSQILKMLGEGVQAPMKALLSLLGIMMLCALLGSMKINLGEKNMGGIMNLVGTLCICMVVITPIVQSIVKLTGVIQGASTFMLACIPVLVGIMIANGQTVTASSYNLLMLGTTNSISFLSAHFLAPCMNIFLGFSVVSAISPTLRLSTLCNTISKIVKWVLGPCMSVFTGLAYHSKFTGRLCGCHHQSNTSLCGQQFCTCGRQCIGRSIEHSAGMYQGTQRWCRRIWSAGSGFYVPAHFD